MSGQPNDRIQRELADLAHREVDAVALRRVRLHVMGWAQAETNRRWLELSRTPRWLLVAGLVSVLAIASTIAVIVALRRVPVASPTPQSESSIASVMGDDAQWKTVVDEGIEHIDLSDGTLRLRIHRKNGTKRVIVRTPDGEIEDVGTTFHVVVRDGRTIAVGVDEGSVTVRVRDLSPITLRAGEAWERAPEPAPIEHPTPAPPAPRAHATPRASIGASPPASAPAPEPDADGEDAAYLEILQALRSGQRAHARALAEAYLRNFPEGFRRTEVERVAHD